MHTADKGGKAHRVLSTRVKLAARVTVLNVDLCLIDEASNHGIVRSVEDLQTHESAVEHDTSTVAFLGAPSNLFAFGIGNGGIGSWGSPKTEV